MSSIEPARESTSGALITGTGALFLFLLLRLLAVCDYNWNVAFAVIHTVDLNEGFGILVGTLMGEPLFTGIALALIAPLPLLRLLWPGSATHRGSALVLIAVVTTAYASLLVTYQQWWLLAITAAVTLTLVGLHRWRRHGRLHQAGTLLLRRAWLITGLLVLVLAALVRTPWVPLEHITLTDRTEDGYVMETSPGFLKILTAEDREFLIIPTDEVTAREEKHVD
ncbi:hypothetical protein HT102_06460 [Hoyosella sp. G463]|uniref:Uncharacterized protein n=1 Tax=Lolliginicoccus lacisalsi TaxID=2742202 RepID=A0A927PM90_9ACTN|nr:hypothetical protein [Lolliginicoccus lacisalsi]MBD8506121.1 hypothetical protein [Lolliginicoccus lacisalsi]